MLPSLLHMQQEGKSQNCMAVEAMGGCGLCLAPLLRPSIVHGTRRLAMGHSLPVKYSPAAVLGITLSLGARHTLQHWMYFSHHQHAQEAPCCVLVLAPKRSEFKEAWFRSLWEPEQAGGVYMLVMRHPVL